MGSKAKLTGNRRRLQFQQAFVRHNVGARSFFFKAAFDYNERERGRAGFQELTTDRIEAAIEAFEQADSLGSVTAPKWAHDFVDRTIGLAPLPKPRSKGKVHRRQQRQRQYAYPG